MWTVYILATLVLSPLVQTCGHWVVLSFNCWQADLPSMPRKCVCLCLCEGVSVGEGVGWVTMKQGLEVYF